MRRALLASLLLVACKSPPSVRDPGRDAPPVKPQDLDRDGSLDGMDACLKQPGMVSDGCPETDRDGDGLIDSVDKCPDEPGTGLLGCPLADTDGDGLFDPEDECKAEPETKNGYLDHEGCPDEIPEDLAATTGIVHGIMFEIDKDILKPVSFPILDRISERLKRYPAVRIEISGHSDGMDQPDYGRNLSRRRADAIKKYLVEHGIEDSRLETRGAQGDEPIATNKTAAGRAKNRRIEFTILIQ